MEPLLTPGSRGDRLRDPGHDESIVVAKCKTRIVSPERRLRRGLKVGSQCPASSLSCSLVPWFPCNLPLVYRKTTLYIDFDDTIFAEVLPGSGRDLRPCVITHLTVLGQLSDCCWLTSWPYSPPDSTPSGTCVKIHMQAHYGNRINETIRYANRDHDHLDGKAGCVLRHGQPEDWHWREDPIPIGERDALTAAGKLDRYIPVV